MSLGPLELAMLAAIALLFFGPAKLPQLGKSIGEAIRGFKGAMNDMNDEINRPEPGKTPTGKTTTEEKQSDNATSNHSSDNVASETADTETKQKEKDPAR